LKKGFTLIELLVAIGIIGIVLGISTLLFPKMISNSRVDEATSKIVTYLETAMRNSLTKGYENAPTDPKYRLYGVKIENLGSSYKISLCPYEGEASDKLVVVDDECEFFNIDSKIDLITNSNEVIFNKRGTTGKNFSITLKNNYNYTKKITISGAKINVINK